MPQVLEGLRVVDVTTGPVGGMATMVLADFGADVIKVEPPGRRPVPVAGRRARCGCGASAVSIADLGRRSGRELTCTPSCRRPTCWWCRGRRRGPGAGASTPTPRPRLRPDLVHCSITGWGPAGPLAEVPAYDGAVAARGGRMLAFERQLRRGGPVFSAVPGRQPCGRPGGGAGHPRRPRRPGARRRRPQRVETSLLQGLLPFDLVELLLVEMAERSGVEAPNILAAGGDLPTLNYHPVRTKDGRWIQCGNLLEHLLMAFLEATDLLGEMLADPRFIEPPGMWDEAAVEAARDLILLRMQERTADEWMDVFRANGNVAAEAYLTTADGLYHPDLVAGGDIVTIDDPVRRPGPHHRPDRRADRRPRPSSGDQRPGRESTRPRCWRAAAALGRRRAATRRHAAAAAPSGRPLDGITVVELATIIAAPLSTVMLADLGARVIKVETLDGDPYRHLIAGGTPVAKTTAGKPSICVDLKSEEGRRIARELLRTADVVRVQHPTGCGRAARARRARAAGRTTPALVWVSVTGYGRHSPSTNRPATHPCAGAGSGGAAIQAGRPSRHRATRWPTSARSPVS